MTGLPDITVTGTVVADPELKFTPTGTAVANFTVAANDRRYDKNTGQWVDAGATFLRCSIWRDAAENVAESLTKGARVLLTGALRQREWQTPEGDKRYAFEVDVTEIGPSLKWATAKVAKATRTPANANASGASGADPWAATPAAGTSQPDEPPF
ncbi:MAG: single-stranded DNA-binding protein [Actinophytocola sp.]|nr:single-stranded DNA-binding protein [Actinophytocola sp.]